MNSYFFQMSKDEKNNILNQHKYLYDGYVTIYNQENNKTPIYVQDLANDKMGLTVNNKGVVKPYGNMGINESHKGLDMIGGDSHDQSEMKYRHLKNGTVDFSSIDNDNDDSYISLGMTDNEDDHGDLSMYNPYYGDKNFDFDIELDEVDDTILDLKPEWSDEEEGIVNDIYNDNFDEVDEEEKDGFLNKLNESLDMFRRFKKYN